MMAAATPRDRSGERFGQWCLGVPIGRGAHCYVYRAKHSIDGREAALKVLDRGSALQDAQEAFFRELSVMERFSTKNMPKYYGFINSKDAVAIAMQMARQGDMLDFINSRGAMTESAAGLVFGQVCRTLSQAHKAGISHRDIKLENLLIDGESVLICDWGLAAFVRNDEYLTKPCGTHGYCAPEVAKGLPYCGSLADMYSLGVVLFALLVGFLPTAGPKAGRVFETLSPEAQELVIGLLESEPNLRWTMRQVKTCKWWKLHCEEESGISRAVKGMFRRISS